MSSEEALSRLPQSEQMFQLLPQLLAMSATEVNEAVYQTAQLIAQTFHAEKVDVFLYDSESQSLIAFGTSITPMGVCEREIGLDCIPLAQGGRVVEVYQTGQLYWTGQAQQDPHELTKMKEELGIKSEITIPLSVGGERRGVLFVCSSVPHFFQEAEVRVLEAVANWVGVVVHRAELSENYANELADSARRREAEELLTVMAHDLRNDLTPLKGRLELLSRRAQREGLAFFVHELEIINQAVLRLNRLVTDLLDAERLKQGLFALHRQSIDLVQIIEDVVPIWETPGHPIQVQAPASLSIVADPDRLQQVIENLLSNAVTHADPGTPVQIVVTQVQQIDGLWARITVTNQGPRMFPEQLRSLFQPFTKGDHSRGLGIGLYISQQIALAHQGTLTAQNEGERTIHLTLALPAEASVSPTT